MNMISTLTVPAMPTVQHAPDSSIAANFDFNTAHREGWTVSEAEPNTDGTPGVQLQRLDDPEGGDPCFPGDKEVWTHVVARARAGSALHRQALALVDPCERFLIEATCGPV